MEYTIPVADLPIWVDNLVEPQWTNGIISYYKNQFVVPRKSYRTFLKTIRQHFDIVPIDKDLIPERASNNWREKIICDRAWRVIRDDSSEVYYQFLEMQQRPIDENVIIYYSKKNDLFQSNSHLLFEKLFILRGVDDKDINERSVHYVDYYMSFWGYNSDLRWMKEKMEESHISTSY